MDITNRPRVRRPWLLLFFQLASTHALAERSLRVLIADVGREVAWMPGDRRTLRQPTPSQVAALQAATMESMMGEHTAVVAMLPAVSAAPAPEQTQPVLAPGGGGRRAVYTTGVHDEGTRRDAQVAYRRAFSEARAVSSGFRVAALCAVRKLRTTGARTDDGVGLAVESATLEVVGRVAIRRLDVLNEMAEPYWDDDASAGGAALVAAVGGRAVLEDAWVDEIQSSPVHLVHALRPIADDCARLHDAIRARLTVDKIDLALDRPLADAADAATAAADDATLAGAAAAPVLDAYGDVVAVNEEIDELRAVSFAAWRALRPPYGPARAEDVLFAFSTRSTAARLELARELLLARLEGLRDA